MKSNRSQPQRYLDQSSDSTLETLQHAIKSAARAVEILGLLRLRRLLPQPLGVEIDFARMVREFEICLIKSALYQAGGQQKKAAALLNLKPTTLCEKMKSYGLSSKIGE